MRWVCLIITIVMIEPKPIESVIKQYEIAYNIVDLMKNTDNIRLRCGSAGYECVMS